MSEPVTLTLSADEMVTLLRAELALARAIAAAHQHARAVQAAQQASGAALDAVVLAHGHATEGTWTLDDATSTLTRTA